MMYQIQLERFEGPMDLLLQLIEKQDLDITEIALAQVTDQYVQYLETVADISPDELADFLVIAAKLLHLKSKTLLPILSFDEDDEEDAEDLAEQLQLYQEFVGASSHLQALLRKSSFLYVHERIPLHLLGSFYPPDNAVKSDLKEIYEAVISGMEPLLRLPEQTLEKTLSLQEKVEQLKIVLAEKKSLVLSQILQMAGNKTEIVLSFIAILELLREQQVTVRQESLFGEIALRYRKA